MANALSSHLRGVDESSRNLQNQSAPPHSGTTHLSELFAAYIEAKQARRVFRTLYHMC